MKAAKITIYIVATFNIIRVEINVETKIKTSKGFNGNQNLKNNYGNTDTTEVNNNNFNPSINIIRVYIQQPNNDNNTNTTRISNNYTISKEDLPVYIISQPQRIQPVELEGGSSTRLSSSNPNTSSTIKVNFRTPKSRRNLSFRSHLPK